jgi:adenylate cyclase
MSNEEHATRPRPERLERKLAAILHADVQGYSRLLGEDEVTTLRTVSSHLALMRGLVEQHGGRAVGSRGDSLLAEFPSVVDAVQCAVEMQHGLQRRNAEVPRERRVEFRIGINLGEVVIEGDEIYGEGVNIAVRLEGLAEAGGICLSEVVYQQLKNKLALTYEDLGEQRLKNIAEPVHVWQVLMDDAAAALARQGAAGPARPVHWRVGSARRLWPRVTLAGVLLLVSLFGAMWHLRRPLFSPPDSALTIQTQPILPLPDKPSIVVLPFVNMSEDPKQDYFSDGLTEVLTGDLSKISSLFVIARNSAFTYKGKAVKVQDVGREMGVRYVLEGSVLKADNQVRITAQLIDATTGYHLWSERYDRPLQNILPLQDEIVQQIVTTLKLQLTLEEQGYLVRKHTDNLEAYDAFLRGWEQYHHFTKETNAQAQRMFEKAFALDPQYAEAYAGLGLSYWQEWAMHWSADPQTLEHALALAQQAITLDISLPIAHSVLSNIYAWKQQYDQAIAEGDWAIALDPNNADSYAWQAQALNNSGRPEAALQMMAQAMRLSQEQFYAAAAAFGARHMNVGSIGECGTLPALGVVAEQFAALCDRAAHHGLLVALEFLPWSDIGDAGTAWEIVRQAACNNGGILIDSWHYFRGAADPAQVRAIPAEHFCAIQFDDADAVQISGMLEDTTQRRRLPGEGAFDLVGFVQMLDEIGVQAPVSVEIISTAQQARPLAEAARLAHETTRAVLAQARAGVS